jgi:hypothetical protein
MTGKSDFSFAMCDLCGRDNTTYPMLDYIFCVADVVRPDGTPDRLTVLCGECRAFSMPEIQARYEQCYGFNEATPECPSGSPEEINGQYPTDQMGNHRGNARPISR